MHREINIILWIVMSTFTFFTACTSESTDTSGTTEGSEETIVAERWSEEKANLWMESQPWLRGANFNPSTAINQLEFWQAESFDPETIDRELGWAKDIGLNCMRVYLHHVAWEEDKSGFKERIDQYLTMAPNHGISTIFVVFDDCWNPTYAAGKQPDPKPGIHNSGWVQDPGELLYTNDDLLPVLEAYVKDILGTFKADDRIILWDLYNEPGNSGYGNKSIPLVESVFQWARQVDPSQPITIGVWNNELKELNAIQLNQSDIITYHNYSNEVDHQGAIDTLKNYNRPMICTEYMARKYNSLFRNIMPILKAEKIGAINWGLVAGKSNTKYAWSEPIPDGSEPELWFHEIFRNNGEPYDPEEVDLIKSLTMDN